MTLDVDPLLPPDDLDHLREALADYTVDTVHDALGLLGQAAHSRADLSGVARALAGNVRRGAVDDRLRTLITLFLLGGEVDEAIARVAFGPLPLDRARAAGFVAVSAGSVRAGLEIRPYAEASAAPWQATPPADPWWVVSDLGSDVRPGPLPRDHVLGIGSASVTLAQATPRAPVGRALDVGTGCGVQALHLAGHSARVTATDVSGRALTLAATTAALSGQRWDLRQGTLLEPVNGEQYDLIVANPPFVVSAGGNASENDWRERVTGWLAGRGCDAWIWQREIADPGQYVSLWLRDAGESPGSPRWAERYDAWLDWFDRSGVAAVGMGLVALRRQAGAAGRPAVIVAEDVPQALEQPVGGEIADWFVRRRWLRDSSDDVLLETVLRTAPGVVRTRDALPGGGGGGWQDARDVVRQSHALRWEVEVDDGHRSPDRRLRRHDAARPGHRRARRLTRRAGRRAVTAAALPVVRDLVGRGFLLAPVPTAQP